MFLPPWPLASIHLRGYVMRWQSLHLPLTSSSLIIDIDQIVAVVLVAAMTATHTLQNGNSKAVVRAATATGRLLLWVAGGRNVHRQVDGRCAIVLDSDGFRCGAPPL